MSGFLNFKESKKLDTNDVLVYKNGCWTNVRKSEFFHQYFEQIKECENKLEALRAENAKILNNINEKLESYHKILQTLTKED